MRGIINVISFFLISLVCILEHEDTRFDQEIEKNPLITLGHFSDEKLEDPEDYMQGITCDQKFEEVSINELENQTEEDHNKEELEEKIEELFEITSNLNLETDLGWYLANSENEMEVFTLFRELTELIIGVK